MWVFALTIAASASAIGAWVFDRLRSRSKNDQGRCGACGILWTDESSGEPYLIHGRLVCEECALKARRRMPWELAALGVWAALLTAVAVGNLVSGSSVAVVAVAVAGAGIVVPLAAVQAMKLANRKAQERIALGESSTFKALSGEGGDEPSE